jgi:hypothetical protein
MDYVGTDIKELKDRAKKIDKTVSSTNRYRHLTIYWHLLYATLPRRPNIGSKTQKGPLIILCGAEKYCSIV